MAIALVLGVPAAYGMGRYRVKGGNVFLLTFLISQMLPPSLTLTPMYLIFSKLGFLGNHLTAPGCDCSQFYTVCNRNIETLFQKYSGIIG